MKALGDEKRRPPVRKYSRTFKFTVEMYNGMRRSKHSIRKNVVTLNGRPFTL